MPQFQLVQQAQRSPGYCMCCGTTTGPFVDLAIPYVKVATAVGILDAEGGGYLCVGTDENPGCAVQVGRMTETMVDSTALAAAEEMVAELQQTVREQKALLARKSVRVSDLLEAGVITTAGGGGV